MKINDRLTIGLKMKTHRECNKCGELKSLEKFGKKSPVRCIDCLNAIRREQRLKKKNDIEYQLQLAYDKVTTLRAIELGKKCLSLCRKCGAEKYILYERDLCDCGHSLSRRFYRRPYGDVFN